VPGSRPAWKPGSICGLYKGRWGIEVFLKQLKLASILFI
jgi:hypothetical protein